MALNRLNVLPGVVDEAEGDALLDAEVHLAGAVLDSLLQVDDDVHAALAVGDRDGDVLEVGLVLVHVLDDGQGLLADDAGLLAVVLKGGVKQFVGQLLGLQPVEFFFVEGRLDTHGGEQVHLEAFVVLGFLIAFDEFLAEVIHHVVEVDGETLAKQGVTAFLVDDLALGVHHVVVFEQVLTYAEVVLFDLLLCLLNLLGDHRVLDDFAFLKAHAVHDASDTL